MQFCYKKKIRKRVSLALFTYLKEAHFYENMKITTKLTRLIFKWYSCSTKAHKNDFETFAMIYMFYILSDPRFKLNVQHRNGTT